MIVNSFDVKYFIGVVEDRDDPMKLGRVKVRVYSLHSYQNQKDDISGIPTEDLLWLYVIQPVNSASVSGVGSTPVGIVRGTHVFGLYLDKYYLNGVVLGTYGGNNSKLANTNTGFGDPLGIYPKSTGIDTDNLSKGGLAGENDQAVVLQNRNLDIGINPTEGGSDDNEPDDDPDITPLEMLERDEGVKTKVYWDTIGYPTVGIGHLIIREKTRDLNKIGNILTKELDRTIYNEITMDEVAILFSKDYINVLEGIQANTYIADIFRKVNKSRKLAIINMVFQLGIGGLSKFKNALESLDREDFKAAGQHLRDSLWYNQTLGRATRVIRVIETGNMESYGIMKKSDTVPFTAEANPEDPFTPEDTRIMFTEPKSPYKGEYPFNKVQTTEGGHVFEVDDTPGYERIKNKHTSGTYEEISPSGEKVTKIVADNYTLIHGNDHLLVEGDIKIVISKDANVYIMGNVRQTIDGNVNQIIRGNNTSLIEGYSNTTINGNLTALVKGNVDSTIEGNNTSLIKGDNTSTIEGNSVSTIKGNLTETIEGDVTRQINGSYTMNVTGDINQTTSANWYRNSVATYDISSATFTIDGSAILIG